MKHLFTVIGNPVAHSRSPQIHIEFGKQTGLDVHYDKTESAIDGFEQTVRDLIGKGYHGANVTVPFKLQAYQLADVKSDAVDIAKAANVLKFLPDGTIMADNTDGAGLVADIQNNLHFELQNKNILILGAGGATRGILHPLLTQRPNKIVIANRTHEKAVALADEFKQYGNIIAIPFNELTPEFDLIIDSTSFNAWPLSIDDKIIAHSTLVYDLKYGDNATPILPHAKSLGVKQLADGTGMLLEQAALSFKFWTGVLPEL